MHWTEEVIGKPWKLDARGPDEFDCWGLVHWVYKNRIRIKNLPDYPVGQPGVLSASRIMGEILDGPERPWVRIGKPAEGALVAFARNEKFLHVGIWTGHGGGFVVHVAEGKRTVAEKLARMRGYSKIAFYVHEEMIPGCP